MYTRLTATRGLEIVENYREGGKVCQRVVLHVGTWPSIAYALKRMPRDVRGLRSWAVKTEQSYDEALLWGGYPEETLAKWKAEAERSRRKLNEQLETLAALKQLVEEHLELLQRDRARAERDRQTAAESNDTEEMSGVAGEVAARRAFLREMERTGTPTYAVQVASSESGITEQRIWQLSKEWRRENSEWARALPPLLTPPLRHI